MEYQPYWPIIYVRGYAMTQREIDETSADPFCGFNVGSAVFRATADKGKPARKFIFESPVIRLAKDFQYSDVYKDGMDISDEGWTKEIPVRSIIVYRYYDPSSALLGGDQRPDIRNFASGLSQLILKVRDRVCQSTPGLKVEDFRCHLVAHSMGGLVCRAFLQNKKLGCYEARRCVDKLFTYATPHNGIELGTINVPEWMSFLGINTFSREHMADYLDLKQAFKKTGRVDWIPESVLPAERVFCAIGSNRVDFEAALGISRTFAGHGSDGLVRIDNASLCSIDDQGNPTGRACGKAVMFRSHAGRFGIVNGEESYQNLIRFLFGDLRVDASLDLLGATFPESLEKKIKAGSQVKAVYQVEAVASVKGKPWYLTRRMVEEDSVICRSHMEIADKKANNISFANVFLGTQWDNPQRDGCLAYALHLAIRVPDYELDHALWFDEHFEGSYLFRDTIQFLLQPGAAPGDPMTVKYDWVSTNKGQPKKDLQPQKVGQQTSYAIPFEGKGKPGIKGVLKFVASGWNA